MLPFWTWPRQRIIEKKVARESIVDRATEKYIGHGALKFRQAFVEILVGNNPIQPGQPTKGVPLSFEDLFHVQRKKIGCAQYYPECYGHVSCEFYNSLRDTVKSRMLR